MIVCDRCGSVKVVREVRLTMAASVEHDIPDSEVFRDLCMDCWRVIYAVLRDLAGPEDEDATDAG